MLELYNHALMHVFLPYLKDVSVTDHKDDRNPISTSCVPHYLWAFTLPQLFERTLNSYFCVEQCRAKTGQKEYLEFRKLIYTNPTNEFLQHHGGVVDILTPGLTHNQTVFVLRRKG